MEHLINACSLGCFKCGLPDEGGQTALECNSYEKAAAFYKR